MNDIFKYFGGSFTSFTASPEDSFRSPQNSIQIFPETSPLASAKFGKVVPNRVFVGGISPQTTNEDLTKIFQRYGRVIDTNIVICRRGLTKRYGFVTFETKREVLALFEGMERKKLAPIILHGRLLNIAPAIQKNDPILNFFPYGAPYSTRATYYHSQRNVSPQYYYQSQPIQAQEPFYHSQDECQFARSPMPYHSYYAAPPPAVNRSRYCTPPDMIRTAGAQSIPYFARRTHSELSSFSHSPSRISPSNSKIYQIEASSPTEPSYSNMWQFSTPPCSPYPLFDSMDDPPYFNRFMFTGPRD